MQPRRDSEGGWTDCEYVFRDEYGKAVLNVMRMQNKREAIERRGFVRKDHYWWHSGRVNATSSTADGATADFKHVDIGIEMSVYSDSLLRISWVVREVFRCS